MKFGRFQSMFYLMYLMTACLCDASDNPNPKGKGVDIQFCPMPNPLDREKVYYIPVFFTNHTYQTPTVTPPNVTQ